MIKHASTKIALEYLTSFMNFLLNHKLVVCLFLFIVCYIAYLIYILYREKERCGSWHDTILNNPELFVEIFRQIIDLIVFLIRIYNGTDFNKQRTNYNKKNNPPYNPHYDEHHSYDPVYDPYAQAYYDRPDQPQYGASAPSVEEFLAPEPTYMDHAKIYPDLYV